MPQGGGHHAHVYHESSLAWPVAGHMLPWYVTGGIMIEARQMSIVWLYCGALQCSALL